MLQKVDESMENMVEIADKVESPLPITIVCSFLKESILEREEG